MIWVLPALFGYYPHDSGTTRIMRVIPAGTNVGLRVMRVRVKPAGTRKKNTRYPSLVPIHLKEDVKASLNRHVNLGIIEKLPLNTLTEW